MRKRRCWVVPITLALLALAPAAGGAARVRVAVLPVVVHSLDGHAYLRAGLAEMIASRLGQSPEIAVLRVEQADQATADLEQARASARALGAEYVLFGSFTHFGEAASLDLSCAAVDASGPEAPRRVFVQSGTLGEIIPQLDALAQKVTLYLKQGAGASAVSAAPAGGGAGEGSQLLLDALSELEMLRERVDALEQRLFESGAAPGGGAEAGGSQAGDADPGAAR